MAADGYSGLTEMIQQAVAEGARQQGGAVNTITDILTPETPDLVAFA